ncbi:hypothetical protein QBC45DRAFT_411588 [Copromyces sp. CBS 386.78]|uniref:Uncharacterized protein n=1 Tax=Pseudoneurospora amorphoporcata TaxID=241081 RepID=A0AAN6SFP9_9PEZI|nr:hypothetical protein QBC45DRAFT_411588 [Copromyces sp. CBS 386.78]KAK3951498.1 hypothetical protein QBC32DRAFT_262320 [Pseudoneurospora amorphoporcata]
MLNGKKIITIGLVVTFGIVNGYYTFAPSLQAEKDKREGLNLGPPAKPSPYEIKNQETETKN